jgi:hypothetical protein
MKTTLIFALVLFTLLSSNAQRGRVQIQDGTLVTDRGTLLRGAFVGINNPWNEMPPRENVTAIKNLGLNCIHLYTESYWDENRNGAGPGYLFDKVDSLVTWTAQDSLYLIITFAGLDIHNDTNVTFVKDCWEIYSERYKDETHVIFEIFNEPTDVPFSNDMINLEKELYAIIRSNAPETHILLLSPWNFFYDEILTNIEMLDNVDWSNSSIAGHAYQRPAQDYIEPIQRIKNAGYAITVTEFHSFLNQYANLALSRVFEEEFVSYLHFIDINELTDDPSVFKSRIESSEVRWTPDYGTWPEDIAEINYQSPFKYWPAIFYDEGSGWENNIIDATLEYISDDNYVAYYNLYFDEEPVSFEVLCSSSTGSGAIEIHLDSINGPTVGVCNISNTTSLSTYEYFKCDITTPFEGIHKIYLVFRKIGSDAYLFNLQGWYFGKSEILTPQTPYRGAASLLPGKIEAEEYDIGGQTISFLDLDTANQGSFFRNDDVDIDTTKDGGYCIGWTESGEWLEYTVSCQQDTVMDIQLRIASTSRTYKLSIKLNNQLLTRTIIPNTGDYYSWETITIEGIQIPAGENQIVRIEFLDGYMNLDWLNFVVSNPSGVDEAKNNTFTFYPNPSHDYIKFKTTEQVNVEIFSMQGQLLIAKKISSGDDQIPVRNLTSGSYILKASNETEIYSEILIVE